MSVLHENILIGQSIIVTTTIGQTKLNQGLLTMHYFSKSLYINPLKAREVVLVLFCCCPGDDLESNSVYIRVLA